MIESHAIPYEPARLRGERLLVLAPHPDDEVIACGGLVAQHIRERRTVRVVVATAGAQAGDAALAAHASQAAVRDYVAYARGLNAYRAMTMPPEVKFAEGYYVVDLPSLRTISVAALQHAIGDARSIEVVSETIPISVIVRTKD